MVTLNENTKEKILDKKLFDIDRQIKKEKRKNRIFIILFILALLIGTLGCIFFYTHYLQGTGEITIWI